MVAFFSGGRKNSTFSSSRSTEAKKASSCSLVAGSDFRGMAKGSAPPVEADTTKGHRDDEKHNIDEQGAHANMKQNTTNRRSG